MKGLFRYKYMAGAAVVLVLVLFFATLIGSILKRNSSDTDLSPTLFPTRGVGKPGGFEGQPALTYSDFENGQPIGTQRVFSADQLNRLKKFDQKIPYSSKDFDIDYSKLLDQYFVALKSDDSQQKFLQFLRDNSISDIYNVYRDLFVTGTEPVYNQIRKAEDEYLKNQSNQ